MTVGRAGRTLLAEVQLLLETDVSLDAESWPSSDIDLLAGLRRGPTPISRPRTPVQVRANSTYATSERQTCSYRYTTIYTSISIYSCSSRNHVLNISLMEHIHMLLNLSAWFLISVLPALNRIQSIAIFHYMRY